MPMLLTWHAMRAMLLGFFRAAHAQPFTISPSCATYLHHQHPPWLVSWGLSLLSWVFEGVGNSMGRLKKR